MPIAPPRYADWKAPAGDGEVTLWPPANVLLEQTRANLTRLGTAESARVQNVPLPELRRRMRAWIGHADQAKPIVATGHQTELYHPGVWAKHALINPAAERLGGAAYFFAVDTDQPKHLNLRWPIGNGGAAASEPITDDAARLSAEWSGQLASPTPAHLAALRQATVAIPAVWQFEPALPDFLDAAQRKLPEAPPLSQLLTDACHALDWQLGLRHHAMLAGPLFNAEPYLAMAHHVCARAGAFAASYNRSLAAYRGEQAIANPGRPMPDLKGTDVACEVPFWLDELTTGHRDRATLVRADGRWCLLRSNDVFAFDPAADGWAAAASLRDWLRLHDLRLAPRALTLTMFIRLLIADQFVHGIGGGRYDQVLDRLIADHFHLEPPHFAVTTATLFFPAAMRQPRVCMPCIWHEGHQLEHRLLGQRKRIILEMIATAPRRSLQRAELFNQMHAELAAAARRSDDLRNWQTRLRDAELQAQRERVLFDRELFYGLQPAGRLQQIIERYHREFA